MQVGPPRRVGIGRLAGEQVAGRVATSRPPTRVRRTATARRRPRPQLGRRQRAVGPVIGYHLGHFSTVPSAGRVARRPGPREAGGPQLGRLFDGHDEVGGVVHRAPGVGAGRRNAIKQARQRYDPFRPCQTGIPGIRKDPVFFRPLPTLRGPRRHIPFVRQNRYSFTPWRPKRRGARYRTGTLHMAAKRSIRLLLEGLDTRVVPAVDIAPPTDDPDVSVITSVDDETTDDDEVTDDEVTTTDDDDRRGSGRGEANGGSDDQSPVTEFRGPGPEGDRGPAGAWASGAIITMSVTVTNKAIFCQRIGQWPSPSRRSLSFVKAATRGRRTMPRHTPGSWTSSGRPRRRRSNSGQGDRHRGDGRRGRDQHRRPARPVSTNNSAEVAVAPVRS